MIITLAFLLAAFAPVSSVLADSTDDQSSHPTLSAFSISVQNSNAFQITGVYVPGLMAFPVVQKPNGQSGYVSTSAETLTQFAAASKYGTTVLLAHNYLAETYFLNLSHRSVGTLVYGESNVQYYHVTAVLQFKALSPNSPYSKFVNLAQPEVTLSSTNLLYQTHRLGNVLILQTCIASGVEPS